MGARRAGSAVGFPLLWKAAAVLAAWAWAWDGCPLVQLSSLAAPSSYSDPLLSALRPLPTDGLPAYVGT